MNSQKATSFPHWWQHVIQYSSLFTTSLVKYTSLKWWWLFLTTQYNRQIPRWLPNHYIFVIWTIYNPQRLSTWVHTNMGFRTEERIWLSAHMSRCTYTALHLRSSLPSSVFFFHPFFSQEKGNASHGWEVCVKHTPQHVHSSQRSDKLTEKTFSDAWRVNSICLIFCHQRSYEFYSRHRVWKREGGILHPYDCPLCIIHQMLLFCGFFKCFLHGQKSEGKMLNCSDKCFRVLRERFTMKDSQWLEYPKKVTSPVSSFHTSVSDCACFHPHIQIYLNTD